MDKFFLALTEMEFCEIQRPARLLRWILAVRVSARYVLCATVFILTIQSIQENIRPPCYRPSPPVDNSGTNLYLISKVGNSSCMFSEWTRGVAYAPERRLYPCRALGPFTPRG